MMHNIQKPEYLILNALHSCCLHNTYDFSSACPPGHVHHNSICYRHVGFPVTWSDPAVRKTKCRRDDGWAGPNHLVTPTSDEEFSIFTYLTARCLNINILTNTCRPEFVYYYLQLVIRAMVIFDSVNLPHPLGYLPTLQLLILYSLGLGRLFLISFTRYKDGH